MVLLLIATIGLKPNIASFSPLFNGNGVATETVLDVTKKLANVSVPYLTGMVLLPEFTGHTTDHFVEFQSPI